MVKYMLITYAAFDSSWYAPYKVEKYPVSLSAA